MLYTLHTLESDHESLFEDLDILRNNTGLGLGWTESAGWSSMLYDEPITWCREWCDAIYIYHVMCDAAREQDTMNCQMRFDPATTLMAIKYVIYRHTNYTQLRPGCDPLDGWTPRPDCRVLWN